MLRIAGAVADGEPVDWATAEKSLPEGRLEVARMLRTLAESSSGTLPSARASEARASEPRAPYWLWAILTLGTLHVLLGLLGAAAGGGGLGLVPRIWSVSAMSVFAGAALWLALGGAWDRRALYLAGVFVTIASSFAYVPANALPPVLGPSWSARAWWNAVPVGSFLPLCLWCFVRAFPRARHLEPTERLTRAAIVVTSVLGVVLLVGDMIRAFAGTPDPSERHSLAYWGTTYALALPALPVCILRARAAAPGEKRRVTRFALSLVVGFGPVLLEILAEALFPPFRRLMDTPRAQLVGSLVLLPPLLSIPIATAHAVMAHQLLDVRVLLGRATRYLLARATLSTLTTLPFLGLAFYLYQHRARPLAELLSGPEGILLLSTGGAGALLLASRDRISRRLDRLFDRSQADWPRLRQRLGQSVRPGSSGGAGIRETAESMVSELERELQLEAATLLVDARDGRWFVPLAGQARPLRSGSALAAIALAEPMPLSTDPGDPRSVFTLLPAEDQRWILDTRTALLSPLTASDGRGAGLVALGAKRDETVYTDEERAELGALCQTVALSLENRGLQQALQVAPAAADEQELPATECLTCRRVHPTEAERCGCGGALASAPLPRLLMGRLELQERLGAGGMGIVYRAFDRELERSVALKTLPRVSEQAARRLRREARSMAAVSHPAVAVIYGVESWQGLPFLVFEYLAGGTLARRLGAPWPVEEALRLGVRLAEALDAIHRRGLLHRDVKPSNIGFDADDNPKLLDFGLARLVQGEAEAAACAPATRDWGGGHTLDGSTRSVGLGGTPLYVPPEALTGEPPGTAQDLWGLSIVLYELMAGRHPFRAEGLDETLKRVGRASVPDLRRWAPDCPEAVARFFARGLDRDPRARPASATALAQDLRALAGLAS